ncbi:glutathione S-transferase family protein [Acidocella sp.]|jgi:glutathione S-transferase|uniref:glutathione S-transferase family protein n=1 Tax=Acidocella sp. TaxID=50710 RepID=UPI002F415758
MAKLYLGTRRYSSWSLRGWLMVRLAGLPAEEIFLRLEGGNSKAVKEVSPSGMVPYLEHDGARVWESLAIAEYCAEIAPALWPEERIARAHARAIAAEMHAGFRALRIAMPMILGRDYSGLGQTPESLADIARIEALWAETRQTFGAGGPYLFGASFNAADAMYAPVVARLLAYRPPLGEAAHAYCAAVRRHPLMVEWYEGAAREPQEWLVEKYEALGQ